MEINPEYKKKILLSFIKSFSDLDKSRKDGRKFQVIIFVFALLCFVMAWLGLDVAEKHEYMLLGLAWLSGALFSFVVIIRNGFISSQLLSQYVDIEKIRTDISAESSKNDTGTA